MNKHLFRIIFNKRRGQRMAVAETSASHGNGAAGETIFSSHRTIFDHNKVNLSAIGFAVLCAMGALLWALPTPVAHAQVVAYRQAPGNQQPTILQTANGLPQVNIQTPSAAGVSRNVYSQFDVQSNGVILNNSRTNAQTQQGGWVQGNPWLATGSARVILNEVNSSNPSQINGYVEVAGQRADVVIANPLGISINGGGFINTNKATLTTGTPILNGGNLESYVNPRIFGDVLAFDELTKPYYELVHALYGGMTHEEFCASEYGKERRLPRQLRKPPEYVPSAKTLRKI